MPCLSPLDNILANWHLLPDPLLVPPSPSDTCSSISADSSDPIRVVCNVPLLAPRPLPYHSPTFLQFDLPDTDEDLSHPPYTHRPAKRKREDDEHQPQKHRPATHRWKPRVAHRTKDRPSPHLVHRPGNPRTRS